MFHLKGSFKINMVKINMATLRRLNLKIINFKINYFVDFIYFPLKIILVKQCAIYFLFPSISKENSLPIPNVSYQGSKTTSCLTEYNGFHVS